MTHAPDGPPGPGQTHPDPGSARYADADSARYADAVDELERILAELEGDDIDVDRLADRVARAAALIRLCRTRISDARIEVERIVADLDGPVAPTEEAAPPPEEGEPDG